MDWALIVFVGLAAPTVIPIESAAHCASAITHLDATMRGELTKVVQSKMTVACIPARGPVPESPEYAVREIIRHEIQAMCAAETEKTAGCRAGDSQP